MKWKIIATMFLATATLALVGCPHQAAVYNVEETSIVSNVNNVDAKDVRKAIIRAGATLGWTIKDKEPGMLEGTLFLRKHVAKVDIPYTTESYSIIYKDSTNLNYDGEKIHSNYNGWIQNLQKTIDVNLRTL